MGDRLVEWTLRFFRFFRGMNLSLSLRSVLNFNDRGKDLAHATVEK